MRDLSNISVVLPSLDPDEKLLTVIDGLIAQGFDDIILVNDGSKPVDYKTIIFEYLLHWRFIAICLVLALVGSYFYLRYQTPVYRINSTVLLMPSLRKRLLKTLLLT